MQIKTLNILISREKLCRRMGDVTVTKVNLDQFKVQLLYLVGGKLISVPFPQGQV